MKVYILFYSTLFDMELDVYGVYSTYGNAENAIPPHEDTDYYDIFETTLDKTFIWDLPEQ